MIAELKSHVDEVESIHEDEEEIIAPMWYVADLATDNTQSEPELTKCST
jgi:hypothetical protein